MRAKVRDVMTSPAETVGEKTCFKAIVQWLRARAVSAVPVVDAAGRVVGVVSEADLLPKQDRADLVGHQRVDGEGHAVGIVSRGDLLAVFMRGDEDIRKEIVDAVIAGTLLLDPAPYTVAVHDGVVTLGGEADRHTDAILVRRLAERVEGVVSVNSDLTYRHDDGDLPAPSRPRRTLSRGAF
jgi:CBS domain-containing protein